jgi:hypothetical protein
VTEDRAIWVYAVAHRVDDDWLDGVTGVDGGPVRAVTEAGLAAAVTTVSLDEFGEEPLRRHLEDLSWLDAMARAHHQVIEIIAGQGPVVPMRLATVFRDDRSVADLLGRERERFATALGEVAGQHEWGIKVYAAERPGPAGGPAPARDAPASPGAAYLRRRREALNASEDSRRAVLAGADAADAALGALATAPQLRPPQAPQLTGQAARMVLNAAYLVPQERSREFAAAADRVAARNPAVRIELTGPWPPYSFTAMESPETAGDRP